jgi:preprotein translocase SecE subunit
MGGMQEQVLKLKTFLSEVGTEGRKVVWPGSKETAGATGVVLVTTAVIAVVLMLYDLLISAGLKVILR